MQSRLRIKTFKLTVLSFMLSLGFVLSGLGLTLSLAAVQAYASVPPLPPSNGSIGPFEFRSEYDPLYQRPPYVTGSHACEDVLVAKASLQKGDRQKSTVQDLKKATPKLAARILKRLISNEVKASTFMTRERAEKTVSLSKAYCRGASIFLIQELDKMGLRFELSPMNSQSITPIQANHVYLIDQNYFGKDEPLIIDPTIRQFFSKFMSEKELEEKIPVFFIGNRAELLALFKSHYQPGKMVGDSAKWTPEYVVNEYLKGYIHPFLFDPSH